ncbi:LytR/AlgR family response regulator transcription factor [Marinoscillum sp.]|uniref:LytR/AlgR family response regulator transcription factor n=1 Tax=Marinoscillum sp. TaxID=2024838 RepID=UPI003BAB5ECC
MNVAIIEDEPFAADRLERLLHEISLDTRVVCKIDSVSKAIDYFNSDCSSLELVFMDVELADGVCFEIFKHANPDVPIIFTTAYDQYAIKAFDLNSLHYLLKPVEIVDVAKAMNKFQTLTRKMNRLELFDYYKKSPKSQYKEHFLGKIGTKLFHQSIDQIAYFYSEDKTVSFVDQSKKKYFVDYNLDELMNHYLNPELFFRVSRKYIVHLPFVSTLIKYPGQRLKILLSIDQEDEIIVSKERVTAFKSWINN